SSFYGPPKPNTLASWGRVLPRGFQCVSKAWDRVTVHTFAETREKARAGQRNPDFLNAQVFIDEVWGPYQEHFADHAGPFVFEFQTISWRDEVSPQGFAELRADLVRLVETSRRLRIPAYLLANNRAEGNAPLTIVAVARMVAGRPVS